MDVHLASHSVTAKRYAEQVVAGEILAYLWVERVCRAQKRFRLHGRHP